jgi:hypothetical protein
MVQPIDYGVQIADPTQAFLGAFQAGASIQDARLKQEQQTQQQANQALIQQGFAKISQPGATVDDVANLAMRLPKDQSESVLKAWALKTDAQKQNSLLQSGKVVSALFAGENDIAAQLINDQAAAMRNSGNEEGAKFLETWRGITDINPAATQNFFTAQLLQLPGGKDIVDNIIKLRTSNIAEAAAPAELREKLAKASEAETKARVAFETETDDIAKAKALREFEQAKAEKETVAAKYAEQEAQDAVKKRLADLNFTKAQITKFNVETRNLNTTGQMLALDYDDAVKGVPLRSKNAGTNVGTATEDERKAAGWLAQADNAYKNMLSAMYTKEGKTTGAEKPEKLESLPFIGSGLAITRSTDRQKFLQASSSLSEALLRAATGAGVNEAEAKQKLEELTPLFSDDEDTRKQKLAAIPMYLQSLQARAGRAAPKDYTVPSAPTPNSVIVNGQTFNRPANFTDVQWSAYKQSMGVQ